MSASGNITGGWPYGRGEAAAGALTLKFEVTGGGDGGAAPPAQLWVNSFHITQP